MLMVCTADPSSDENDVMRMPLQHTAAEIVRLRTLGVHEMPTTRLPTAECYTTLREENTLSRCSSSGQSNTRSFIYFFQGNL